MARRVFEGFNINEFDPRDISIISIKNYKGLQEAPQWWISKNEKEAFHNIFYRTCNRKGDPIILNIPDNTPYFWFRYSRYTFLVFLLGYTDCFGNTIENSSFREKVRIFNSTSTNLFDIPESSNMLGRNIGAEEPFTYKLRKNIQDHFPIITDFICVRAGNGNELLPYNHRYVGNQPQSTYRFRGIIRNFLGKEDEVINPKSMYFKIGKEYSPKRTKNCSIWFHHIYESNTSKHWQIFLNHINLD